MNKSILYRLFKLGAIPKTFQPVLEQEGIVVSDEGMSGWFICKDVKGPGKRYRHRSERFSGWLAVTRKRVLCYSYRKRQINISVDDPKIACLHITIPSDGTLSISFESSAFRGGWEGIVEFKFKTEKAKRFYHALGAIGARKGEFSRCGKPCG
ncbi:MAG: hypothetical protein MI862_21985 [Desulfobacterales bacterium]|nr:hypothetical protein [Desulfobacterales bacterium]